MSLRCLRVGEVSCRQGFKSHRIGAIFSLSRLLQMGNNWQVLLPNSGPPRIWYISKPLHPIEEQGGWTGTPGKGARCVLRGPQRSACPEGRGGSMPIPDARSLENFAWEYCHQALLPVSTQNLTKLLSLLGSHFQVPLYLPRSQAYKTL